MDGVKTTESETRDECPTPASISCPVCGRAVGPWEVDHKQPKARGGLDTEANRWVICRDCNRSKGRRTLHEFIVERERRRPSNDRSSAIVPKDEAVAVPVAGVSIDGR